ncbi:hypothetical protein NKW54_14720 [Acetobacter cerevisiae]|uniref:DUF1436 domain-containing protein n=1 Tax=Acetobacter cerevisiae TaxID=178900 RepID=A0A149UQY4_9PROT|nr:hypothetical protein [Acetobacter cerevisiae]KXV70400.1 hypothetical protein AD952_13005 [Acetobacter cerevisiae]MCP1247177.1 hypothetical protein [Acetobacter cerevisiae]MCP1256737.1 hypothetical protein [Acetobacter cerevisiae]
MFRPPPLTPEQIKAQYRKSADFCRTPKFVAIISKEIWRGSYFSRTGWCAHALVEEATPLWLGENFRKALLSSEYFNKPGAKELGLENIIPMEKASNTRRLAFFEEMRQAYGFKTIDTMWRKDDIVASDWHYRIDDFMTLYASRRAGGGGHVGWPRVKFPQKFLDVPLSVSDEELGQALLKIMDQCEGYNVKRPVSERPASKKPKG